MTAGLILIGSGLILIGVYTDKSESLLDQQGLDGAQQLLQLSSRLVYRV